MKIHGKTFGKSEEIPKILKKSLDIYFNENEFLKKSPVEYPWIFLEGIQWISIDICENHREILEEITGVSVELYGETSWETKIFFNKIFKDFMQVFLEQSAYVFLKELL